MVELWSSWAPLEIKIFAWLALHNRLWTADRLAKRNSQHSLECVLRCQERSLRTILFLVAPLLVMSGSLCCCHGDCTDSPRMLMMKPRTGGLGSAPWFAAPSGRYGWRGTTAYLKRIAAVESVVTLRIRTEFALWLLARTSGSVDVDMRWVLAKGVARYVQSCTGVCIVFSPLS